jgi:hypothetical protein
MGDISEGVTNTLWPAKKIFKKRFKKDGEKVLKTTILERQEASDQKGKNVLQINRFFKDYKVL